VVQNNIKIPHNRGIFYLYVLLFIIVKKQRIIVLTEQDLSTILDKVWGAAGISPEDIFGSLKSKKDSTDKSSSDKSPSSDSSKKSSSTSGSVESKWMNVTKKVIDNFEGGYWNYWECKNHPWHSMYKKSGETMFGLDREAGDIENAVPNEGKQFFGVIDKEKQRMGMESFCNKWKWNYGGGELREKLLDLAARIMKNLYDKNAGIFFKGDTKKVVESSKPLMLHFSYATWNGPGFFKNFADSINQGVKDGLPIRKLVKIAKEDRKNKFAGTYWAQATEKVNAAIDDEAGYVA
jgi:hypothetical protein